MPLTPEELAQVQALADGKYRTWEWNFGRSPQYNVTNKRRYEAGSIQPCVTVEGGKITQIVFYGDFLSVRPPGPADGGPAGLPLPQ